MPSLHFGWAVVIAWAVIVAAGIRTRWRYLVLLHPVVTLAAIVLTANHYWLDAVVAVFLFALALVVDFGDRAMVPPQPRPSRSASRARFSCDVRLTVLPGARRSGRRHRGQRRAQAVGDRPSTRASPESPTRR